MPTDVKMATSNNPDYSTSSCQICERVDTDDMVQCDNCDFWFHFQCVGVDGDIAFKDWKCDRCNYAFPTKSTADKENFPPKVQWRKPRSFRSLTSVSSAQSRDLALQRIEEDRMLSEQRDKEYLRRKYSVLCGYLDEFFELGEHEHNNQQSSFENTLHWAEKVQDLSDELANKFTVDNISISVTDNERETFQKQFLPQASSSTNVQRTQRATNPFSVYKDDTDDYNNVRFDKTEASKKPLQSTISGNKLSATYVKEPVKKNLILPSKLQIGKPFSEVETKYNRKLAGDNELTSRNFNSKSHTFGLPNSNSRDEQMSKVLRLSTTANVPPELNSDNFPRLNEHVEQSAHFGQFGVKETKSQHYQSTFQPTSQTMFQPARQSSFQPANQTQSTFQPASQPQFTFQPTNLQPGINAMTYRQPSMNQPASRLFGHLDVGKIVDYKALCKSNVNLTRSQIAMRQTMDKKYPHFSGEVTKWQMFESAFVNATESCGLTNFENLSRLMECLKGDAMKAVQCLLLHPNSVPGVMETLRLMFGRPELVIQTLLDELDDMDAPEPDDLNAFVNFALLVRNLCSTVQAYNSIKHLQNTLLLKSLVEKLPTQFKLQWASYQHAVIDVDLVTFSDWIYALATVVMDVINTKYDSSKDKKVRKDENSKNPKANRYVNSTNSIKLPQSTSNTGVVPKDKKKCPACSRDFCKKLDFCEKFKKMARQDKWKLIKSNNLCGSCLGNHRYFNCKQKIQCGVAGCSYFHHVLLHNELSAANDKSNSKRVDQPNQQQDDGQKKDCNTIYGTTKQFQYPEIFRIVPVKLFSNGQSLQIFAYFDDGSNLTTMESSVAQQLGLHGTKENLCVKWSFGETQLEADSSRISVQISGVHSDAEKFLIDDVRTVKQLKLPKQSITRHWLNQFPHFKNVPITPYENAIPQLIIGLRHSRLMVSLETLEGKWEQPIVCKTRLGWVVQGPNDKQISMTSISKFRLNMCDCQASFQRLHQLVQDFFSLESFGVKVTDRIVESKELSRARDILESSVVKKDNHFEAALLWRADDIVLPNSFDMALRRLECVESKMKKDPILAARMCDYINDFLAKGYIRKLTLDEQQRHGPRTWYLPVFPVFNPKKPEKLRLVWDAAAKVNGVSLNSQLLVGPDQLEPLPDILRRFREACIGLGTDIIEMYHRVHVTEKDRDSQRFFWREGDAEKKPVPDVYEVNVLPFGLKCSPAIAQFVKNKNAKAFEEQFAKAVEAITRNHYVDDMIERAHDVETAVQLIKDVQLIHRQANFGLRNLVSNNRQVLEAINGCSEFSDKILTDKLDFHVERVLGMFWNTQMDTFTYSLQFIKLQHLDLTHRPTKREVLRIIMSVFDPLGFLTHLLIHAKVILQEIWRSNITWDVQIPESLAKKWSRWLIHLQQVENLHIPRLYSPRLSPTPPKSIQLHVFVDASLDAYATVAYFRIEDNDGVDSCIIGAKSRVAPTKPISVPRLELQGGLLGSRFAESILHSHSGLHVEKTIIWCDSKTVLFWLSTAPRRYSQFVAFRIGEILDSKINAQWRWIPSEFNVADEATKTKDLPELNFSTRWFVGPEFLRSENSDFTFELDEPDFVTTEEVRPYYLLAHVEVPVYKLIDYERFSNWQRLVRTMAYVLRFINNTRVERQRRCLSTISNNELLTAENWLYAQAQYDSFREDISIVRWNSASTVDEHKCFDKTSIIRTCSPYLDKSGVLRVMGRLDNAVTISESARRPIILAKDHYITRLIVYWYHHKHRHLHHQTVLNEIRQKFWIPKLRVLLNTIRNSCQKCKNTSAVAHVPEMGSIPRERFATYTRPFTFTGIDYFGPIKVIVNRGTQKRWGVLFTCMTTRAVHLEIAHSMDTSSCIMSIRNFIGRRGTPQKVRVDNGSNFHGADNALRDEIAKLDRTKIQDEFSNTLIEWSYNPPTAAHMGGIWERMVGIVKRCLDSVLTVRYPTDEMLTSLFIEVENMVNSRPLTYVTLESPYDEVLTPNHFLLGSSNGSKPPGQFSDADLLRNNWKAVQAMTDKFWQKFVDEYIPTLTTRTKWFNKIRPLQVGDVVLLADPGFQRNTWPKGIVIETFEDRTGQVRSAKVRTATGTIFRRPVHHLAILDVAQPDKVKLNSPSSSISPIQLTGSRMLQMDVNTGSVGSVFSSDSSSEVNRSKDETN